MAAPENITSSLLDNGRSEPRPGSSRRWFVFNSSPLARKIILFNLIALGILVSGVLYLNQAQEAQVGFRSSVLAPQAEMISAAIQSHAGNPDFEDMHSDTFERFFESLVTPSNSIVQIYDNTGKVDLMYVPADVSKSNSDTETNAFTGILQKLWTTLSPSGTRPAPEEARQNLQKQFGKLAAVAMVTNTRTKNIVLSVGGEIYIAVAQPLIGPAENRGAILISTRRGEVDSIIRAARQQILQIFLLATLSSIILSMVLANSIARPLRRLSAAAQNAQNEAGGKLNLARVNIPDLTTRPDEIGDLSRSMRNMTDALLDRIDENKSFAADVAHEIKNPLTSLRSAVETLEYVKDDSARSALLAVIKNDVERLDRLVTDISNASRLEADLVRDTWEDIDIGQLLAGITDRFMMSVAPAKAIISVSNHAQNHLIHGLRGRLEQVFNNLISNALSFVPTDGKINIQISDGTNAIVIKISDNGPGIPNENLEDIFSRFYSERPVEQFGEHSGLGLAISKQIIEAHNGTITASNNEDGGALFTVKLPL